MDGSRVRGYWSAEIDALIRKYRQFETLIPASKRLGSAHSGEDGRFVEELIRQYLDAVLPKDLEVLTGFILKPAVKTGEDGRERHGTGDAHSTQLDIIVYDSARYPVFQRLGNTAIVPPEGVIAIISVKKHLNERDIKAECKALQKAGRLCAGPVRDRGRAMVRGPYLALIAVHSNVDKPSMGVLEWAFSQVEKAYGGLSKPTFDEVIGYIGVLDKWSLFKRRPEGSGDKAGFVGFEHKHDESHLGFQFLLTGILSVFCDVTRRNLRRPGITAFPPNRAHDKDMGTLHCSGLR
ncbi:MAG TPA: DUF6602 domain-containing protein [Acidobacteriaceae bacterium]|jgi:hypothetical protein|nr:DUF6602 domain-containing protein [Acidobacteriaceae bacterium]